jgi:hypothetical protein
VTLPSFTPQRPATDSTRSRRARCTAAKRSAAATELRRASRRAQAILAEEAATPSPERAPARTTQDRGARGRAAATAAASARSARVADAVVAQWLLEQVPRRARAAA